MFHCRAESILAPFETPPLIILDGILLAKAETRCDAFATVICIRLFVVFIFFPFLPDIFMRSVDIQFVRSGASGEIRSSRYKFLVP